MSDQHPTEQQVSHLAYSAKLLAVLALQSSRYSTDAEFQQAVDDVLAMTREVTL